MIHDDILDFLRDAQFRVAELSAEIDELEANGESEVPKFKHNQRIQLFTFMEILYEINWPISNGYNHLVSTDTVPVYVAGWTEDDIQDEMMHLREVTGMTEQPSISFTPFWTEVINIINPSAPSGGLNITGNPGQYIQISVSGFPVAVDIDPYGGMRPNETIDDYFNGRL